MAITISSLCIIDLYLPLVITGRSGGDDHRGASGTAA